MCGIIGVVGASDALPILLEGLERLEYRGYDSAGVALVAPGTTWRARSADGTESVAYTPTGTFSVFRRVDGPDEAPLGTLYRPLYFVRGWAIHGSPVVPAYPASHGCARTANWDQDFLFPLLANGAQVRSFGDNQVVGNSAGATFSGLDLLK